MTRFVRSFVNKLPLWMPSIELFTIAAASTSSPATVVVIGAPSGVVDDGWLFLNR